MSVPHKAILYGRQAACPTNVVSFTDNPVVADVTLIRKTHIDELRAAVNGEQTRRAGVPSSWTDPLLLAGQTLPRKIHIDQLRSTIEALREGSPYTTRSCPTNQDTCVCEAHTILISVGHPTANCTFCQDYCKTNVKGYCPSDMSAAIVWTDPTLVANETKVRAIHVNELMLRINDQRIQCVCEAEACNYCADCGHSYQQWYSYCPYGCGCNDHKYAECSYSTEWRYNWVNNCATVNAASMDFVTALQTILPPGITTGDQVPWNCMCSFTAPGRAWKAPKASWGCMCNPFVWAG